MLSNTREEINKTLSRHLKVVWTDSCDDCERGDTCDGFKCNINYDFINEKGFFILWDWAKEKPWWGFLGNDIYQELVDFEYFADSLYRYLNYLEAATREEGWTMEDIENYFIHKPILGDDIDLEVLRAYIKEHGVSIIK